MEEVITTKIYHGGTFSRAPVATYVGNCMPALRYIDKDHFSKMELLYYTKELGYATVAGFYYQDLETKEFVLIESDQHLLDLIKDLKSEDTFEVFVAHVLDQAIVDNEGPVGYLTCNSVGIGEPVNLGGEYEANNTVEENEQYQVYENYNSICSDTRSVPRASQKKGHGGLGRGLGRAKANARGTPFVSEAHDASSQVPPKSSHKRTYNSATAIGTNKRPTSGFGLYSDPTTGIQVFNPGTSSETVLHRPTNLKSASTTNIDIGFKPRGLRWNGKDAVSTSELQRMRANEKNKVSTTCETSKK